MSNSAIRLDDHDGWLLSFANGEKRAYLDVRLFLAAVGKLQYDNHCHAAFNAKDMHKCFPIFAKEMGWPGYLYVTFDPGSKCPAVTLYLRDDISREGFHLWVILPDKMYMKNPWMLDESPVKHKVLEAARVVMREWLPGFEW